MKKNKISKEEIISLLENNIPQKGNFENCAVGLILKSKSFSTDGLIKYCLSMPFLTWQEALSRKEWLRALSNYFEFEVDEQQLKLFYEQKNKQKSKKKEAETKDIENPLILFIEENFPNEISL